MNAITRTHRILKSYSNGHSIAESPEGVLQIVFKSGLNYISAISQLGPDFEKYSRKAWSTVNRQAGNHYISEYQDLNDLLYLHLCLEILCDTYQSNSLITMLIPNNCSDNAFHPSSFVVASTHTGLLNARSFTGRDYTKSIIVEQDLILWGRSISKHIASIFMKKCPYTGSQIFDANSETPDQKSGTGHKYIIQEIVGILTNEKPEHFLGRIAFDTDESTPAKDYISLGFTSFILYHECAHLIHHHHKKLKRSEPAEHYDIEYILEAVIYQETNGKKDFNLDDFLKKARIQAYEIDADLKAFNDIQRVSDHLAGGRIIHPGNPEPDNSAKSLLIFMGVYTLFWSIYLFEKSLGVLAYGEKFFESTAQSSPSAVQNLVYRKKHPDPLYRLSLLIQKDERLQVIDSTLAPLFNNIFKETMEQMLELNKKGKKPEKKWIRKNSETDHHLNFFS